MRKVWAYFDGVGPLTGVPWPITYREPEEQRLARLRGMGVLAFPSLVYPHKPGMGMPEFAAFLDLAERYPRVHLDTTMAFTSWAEERVPFRPALRPRLAALQDRVVLGSDFPNIPYAYAEQLAGLVRLDLGDAWLRSVLHDNGARLCGMSGSSSE